MIRIKFLVIIAWLTLSANAHIVFSPDGRLRVDVETSPIDGIPSYSVVYDNTQVLRRSRLGLLMEEAQLDCGFTIEEVCRSAADEWWKPVWGEYSRIRCNYNEMTLTLVQKEKRPKRVMRICFRVFNDGVGFRYILPEQESMNYLTVMEELTEFNLTGDHTFYCIPGDYDTNEFAYTTAPISKVREGMEHSLSKKGYESKAEGLTVQTPLMIKTRDGLYVNIHEAALVDYSAMLLNVDEENFGLSAHLTPDKLGKKGYLHLPVSTPWRTIIVSRDARDILASQLILNLNEPCEIEDTSWIKPQKFVGVWWEMFTGQGSTWAYSDYKKAKPGLTDYQSLMPNGRHAANTDNVKLYIDFASENGFDAVLVEGWNKGWEDWCSYRKDRQFLFDRPYPDFDMVALRDYAKSKGIRLIMHHETAANAADYERQLDGAFNYMANNGYNTVKTGYVGYVIPRSEYHSSQWMNNHYLYVVKRAADFHIMVDSHEAVRPTGLCRTYPNWLAQESARGGEFESMGGNEPDHTCILPFTRLKGGPMDYTPGLFETKLDRYNKEHSRGQAMTTLIKQLALYVTMPSPLQMAADLPENYRRFADAFQFIKDVAVDWDYSWYLEAEPGDYITVARKAKGRAEWFVGAITDENERQCMVDFSFLPVEERFVATVYSDADDAHWKTNPQSYVIRKGIVSAKTVFRQHLACGGGMAISVRPITNEDVHGLDWLE